MRWLAIILVLLAAPAVGQSRRTFTQDDLKKAEAARDAALARLAALEAQAGAAARDLSLIDADMMAAAAEALGGEEAAYAAEEQLMILADESRTASEMLDTDRAAVEDLLAALITFGSRKPPALAVNPDDMSTAIRAAILMSDTAPALAGRADDLRQKLADIHDLANATRAQQENLAAATSSAGARHQEIAALAAEKRRASASLDAEAAAARANADKLASEAQTLRDLLDGLARSAPPAPSVKPGQKPAVSKPPAQKPAVQKPSPQKPSATPVPPAQSTSSSAKPSTSPKTGAPLYPVVGSPLRRFGRTIDGEKQEGLTLAARPDATVIAPMDARVQYSGLFRTYGQMVILDMGGDVLVVVSGMEAIYPTVGQWVLAGEPIGRMSGQKSPSPELYLEVRRKGQPVDPETWLGKRG